MFVSGSVLAWNGVFCDLFPSRVGMLLAPQTTPQLAPVLPGIGTVTNIQTDAVVVPERRCGGVLMWVLERGVAGDGRMAHAGL